ncbi:MAG TPA: toxin-antitoxin system YwqK family antitoxin [Bacteroidia bacterium]|jgi:antitoxin component YwqK of YwqJK toxin-antitoxin module|nr:toxin-antitoxin system YwqK family antitoxin [Bacteroidia bacterium]
MKKSILFFLFLVISIATFASQKAVVGDTNKTDASGKKTGIWKEEENTYTYFGTYKNGRREGVWIGYHPNGLVGTVEEYKDGRKNGVSIGIDMAGFYFKKDYYTNDTLDGPSIVFNHSNGAKVQSEIMYKMGKLSGLKKVYYPEGTVQEEGYFINNLRNGVSKWYTQNHQLSIEYTYKNGNLDGIQKTYYENGNIASEGIMVNNMEEGEYTEYFQNGKVKLIGKYVHGKKEGAWKEYNEDGKVIKTENYKNNELKK